MKKLLLFLAVAAMISFVACNTRPVQEKSQIPSIMKSPNPDSTENSQIQWLDESPNPGIACDTSGKIVYMNNTARQTFGNKIGYLLPVCCPGLTKVKLFELLRTHVDYTYPIVTSDNIQKMVYLSPWFFQNGVYNGIIEQIFPYTPTSPLKVQ